MPKLYLLEFPLCQRCPRLHASSRPKPVFHCLGLPNSMQLNSVQIQVFKTPTPDLEQSNPAPLLAACGIHVPIPSGMCQCSEVSSPRPAVCSAHTASPTYTRAPPAGQLSSGPAVCSVPAIFVWPAPFPIQVLLCSSTGAGPAPDDSQLLSLTKFVQCK